MGSKTSMLVVLGLVILGLVNLGLVILGLVNLGRQAEAWEEKALLSSSRRIGHSSQSGCAERIGSRARSRETAGRQEQVRSAVPLAYPPAIAPIIRKGSFPDATAAGSGASADSCVKSSWQAKNRKNARLCLVA